MKKLLLIIGLTLFTIFAYSQKPKVSAVRYTAVTTTERDNFTIPAGEFWRIYNTTTAQNEYWDGDSWEPLGAGEINTVSSQGTGTPIFYQKLGVDLQFNAIKSENNLLTVSLDGTTHDVELTVNQGNISITASQVSDFDTEVSNNSSVTDNTAKDTNVPTALSIGTVTATTYGITSDGGADDLVLVEANTDDAGLLGADKWDEIVANTIKTSNVTHTGEVTGATALTLDATAISNKTLDIALLGTEHVLIDDSGLKRTTLQAIADLSGVGANGILQKNLSWGESYINNWRDLVLDDGATYFPNNGGYEKGRLHQLDIIPSLHFIPAAVKAEVIYSIGKNRTNDLDVSNSASTYVDEDGIIQTAAIDFARIDYTDGDGAILVEPQSTNLIERSESPGHSYWTKSNSTIEGDASTAGSELVTNGTFTGNINGWTVEDWAYGSSNIIGTASGIAQSLQQGLAVTDGKLYKISYEVVANNLTSSGLELSSSGAFGFNQIASSVGVHTYYLYSINEAATYDFRMLLKAGSGTLTLDNVSVKEVQGFSAPDGSTNAYKLVATGTNGFIQLASAETISNATSYTNSIFIKRAVGTGNILIKDINNAETNVSTLTGVELADGWTKYDITDTSSSTSGQIGVKLATSGDEVYIFGAQLEEQYLTSYIKSDSGSSTLRLADVITGAGDSSTFNSEEGVLFVEMATLSDDLTTRRISINDGTDSNVVQLYYSSTSNRIVGRVAVGGTTQASLIYDAPDTTDFINIVLKWAENDFSLWIDGVEQATDVSGSTFNIGTLNSLDFNRGDGNDDFFGKVKQLKVYKSISDAQLDFPYITNFFPLLLIGFRRRNKFKIAA